MQALASDFDHTLYIDGELRQEDIAAIRRFQDAQGLFGICTGRPLSGIIEPVGDAITFDFYILDSGALILDGDLQVIRAFDMDHEVVSQLCDVYKKSCDVAILVEDQFHTIDHPNPVIHFSMPMLHDLDRVADKRIFAASLCARTNDKALAIQKEIARDFHDTLSAYVNGIFVDVVAKGCSKGHAIDIVKETFQLSCISGIGDNYNDLPMFSHVDCAFTFHDSPEAVKQAADQCVDSVAEAIVTLLNR